MFLFLVNDNTNISYEFVVGVKHIFKNNNLIFVSRKFNLILVL